MAAQPDRVGSTYRDEPNWDINDVREGLVKGLEHALSLEPPRRHRTIFSRFAAKITGLHGAFEAQEIREHSTLIPQYIEEINSTIDNKGE
jgi:hypothetical protein